MNRKEGVKKFWLLVALLIGPLVFYLLILTGKNEFRRLPVLQKNVIDISVIEPSQQVAFKERINIVCFFGKELLQHKTNALNLNEKIYKHFNGFKDFQFVIILPEGTQEDAKELQSDLEFNTDISNWKFVYTSTENIQLIFNSFKTNLSLDQNSYIAQAFIVDKAVSLRGRNKDEDIHDGMLYGYNSETVSEIHQKMIDDVKILLAEYRLALKKNKKKEVFTNPYKETEAK